MTSESDSLRNWLRQEITKALSSQRIKDPFVIWCDPGRVWKELLEAAAAEDTFEIWSEDTHELLLRERFYQTPRSRRVIWLPVAHEDVTYFKVFELEAADVREWRLPEALSAYGVDIPSDQLNDLEPLLAAHAKEWLDRPRSAWKELTPGNAKGALVDDDRVLELIATPNLSFEQLVADKRFSVFSRRVVEDFGLPTPAPEDSRSWRLQAVASLICTEAAATCRDEPPGEVDRIIPPGALRDRALKLLRRWQKQIDLWEHFEELAGEADALTTLQYWAKNLAQIPSPLTSPSAEAAVFQAEVQRVGGLDAFADIAKHLEANVSIYQAHAAAFWGRQAKSKVLWGHLVKVALVASLVQQHNDVEKGWQDTRDAVNWFTGGGWQLDHAGEALFQEDVVLPGGLVGTRAKLRKAYLRHLDRVNSAFSELLSHSDLGALELPYAGDTIAEVILNNAAKEPIAVLVLDACRYDLGCRLAEFLNQGEPVCRAEVSAARAPIPSITALGMPLCLPGISGKIHVDLPEKEKSFWRVTVDEFKGDLTQAAVRREWLKQTYKLKDRSVLSVASVVDSDAPSEINAKTLGRLVFVFGDEFDTEGHEGQLQLTGSEYHLARYAQVVRRLRSGGYSTVMVVTDHGFFHWEPDRDEVEQKPRGEVLWSSRRAIVGHNLQHPSAVKLQIPASDLECYVPRSINAFKTYGGLGFFHGGATLQELVIPVVTCRWPRKAKKIGVVLKPISQIVSLTQHVEVASSAAAQTDMFGSVDKNLLGRQVLVKVVDPNNGKLLFKSRSSVTIEPGGGIVTLGLTKVEGAEAAVGATLQILVVDADDEEILDQSEVTLKVELDEWF